MTTAFYGIDDAVDARVSADPDHWRPGVVRMICAMPGTVVKYVIAFDDGSCWPFAHYDVRYHQPENTLPLTGEHRDNLDSMFHLSSLVQRAYGTDPLGPGHVEHMQYIKDMTLALIAEAMEALQEVRWKPWASDTPRENSSDRAFRNIDAFRGELVDIAHFLVNLCLSAGLSAEEFAGLYRSKALRNLERAQSGYASTTGKCVWCRADRDDLGPGAEDMQCPKVEGVHEFSA